MNNIYLDDVIYIEDRFIIYWSDSMGESHDMAVILGDKAPKALSDALNSYLRDHKDE